MKEKNKQIGLLVKNWIRNRNMTQREVAAYLEIKPPSLSQMLNGRIALPSDKFLKIIGLVNPGSEDVDKVKRLYFGEMLGSGREKFSQQESEVRPVLVLNEVPVISFAQAAGYEPALEPIDDYAKGCSDETAMFAHEMLPGYFALSVEGDSMSPDFPHGTIILVAGGEFPQRGDVVVAKLRDGQVVVKKYFRRNNVISLDSINPSGKSFEWHCKEDPGFIQWMYPVLEATIDLRRRRWEQARHPGAYRVDMSGSNYAVAEDVKKYIHTPDKTAARE